MRWGLIAAVFYLAMPISAFADCTDSYRCLDVYVERIYVKPSVTYIDTSGDEALLSCTPLTGTYLEMDPANAAYDAWFAILLSAQSQGRAVTIRTDSTVSGCVINYIFIDAP